MSFLKFFGVILWILFVEMKKKIQNNLDVYRVIEVAKNYAGFSL